MLKEFFSGLYVFQYYRNISSRHRYFGSAAINMMNVAQGSVDAYVEYGAHAWDFAAAVVILREAGGIIIDPTG